MDEQEEKPDRAQELEQAQKNLERIERLIAPYIPKDRHAARSTAGKWQETSTWLPQKQPPKS